jgi:hypothetical protein
MGCCESLPNDVISLSPITNPNHVSSSLPLTPGEQVLFQQILTKIPVHCREAIVNLPGKQFLKIYQCHLIAKNYFQRNEYRLASISESEAIKGMESLLPAQKDHFIFIDMYNILTMCTVALGLLSVAIESSEFALAISLKHTPTNYTAISEQYFQLSVLFKLGSSWRTAAGHLTRAIELERLSNAPNQERIHAFEADRQFAM